MQYTAIRTTDPDLGDQIWHYQINATRIIVQGTSQHRITYWASTQMDSRATYPSWEVRKAFTSGPSSMKSLESSMIHPIFDTR